jgi:hypothetical protein
MGKSPFTRITKTLWRPAQLDADGRLVREANDVVLVDLSTELHLALARHHTIANNVFTADPDNLQQVQQVSVELANKILEQLAWLHPVDGEKRVEVIAEDLRPPSETNARRRARRLGQGLRSMLSNRPSQCFHGRQSIAMAMGRPPVFVMDGVCSILVASGYIVRRTAGVSADWTINYLAAHLRQTTNTNKVFVASRDLDYLALSPPTTIDHLLDTRHQKKILSKFAVLEALDLSATRFFLAYCLAGNDNMATKLPRFGLIKSLQLVRSLVDFTEATVRSSLRRRFAAEPVNNILTEMRTLQDQYWRGHNRR